MLTPDNYDSLAVQSGGRLESWMTNPPKPAMWHFTPGQRDAFARAIETEVRKDDEVRIAEHEQALAFLAGLYCGDLTISDPPMTVAERIFDSVMAERAGLKAEIQQKEEALEFLRSAWNRARLEKAP